MPEVLRQYRKCDGHAIFTDQEPKPDEADIYRVNVPPQEVPRSSSNWLYHRNMVGILPSWTYLLTHDIAEKYDWVLNSELDHFMSPARMRMAINGFLDTIRNGSREEQMSADGPLIFYFGNAFVFNRKVVLEMKKVWSRIGRPAMDKRAIGCPEFTRNKMEWPDHCSQDIAYLSLPDALRPVRVHTYGPSGCGQPDQVNSKGQSFPLTCFEMATNPMGSSEEDQLLTIQKLAVLQTMKTEEEVKNHFKGTKWEKRWWLFWMSRHIPIIHHVHSRKVHTLARQLLRP